MRKIFFSLSYSYIKINMIIFSSAFYLIVCSDKFFFFFSCRFFNNAYYAKVGGISTRELNKLEMKLLFDLDFRLQITTETFRKYCLMLENETVDELMMENSYWRNYKISITNHSSESIQTSDCTR